MENYKNKFRWFYWIYVFEVWRAIPDVLGRQVSEAKLAEEGGCVLLLTTKYEPLLVRSERVISA